MNYFLITVKQRKTFLTYKHLSLYFGSRRYFTLHTETNLFSKSQKLPGSELLAHHLCILFYREQPAVACCCSFQKVLHTSPEQSQPILLRKSLKLLQIWSLVVWHGPWCSVHHTDFQWDQSELCAGSFLPEATCVLGQCHIGRKSDCLKFSFNIFTSLFFFLIPSTSMRFQTHWNITAA